MEFLKDILGADLYSQVADRLNAHNGNPENKDAQIKLANLAKGEYVGKGKYDSLAAEKQAELDKLTAANTLIEELKKGSKNSDELQSKVAAYEAQVKELNAKLLDTQLASAIKVGLLSEHAKDVDYLTFKLKAKGEPLELDETGAIKGWNDKISALKVQCPDFFESSSGHGNGGQFDGFVPIDEKSKTPTDAGGMTKQKLLASGYQAMRKFAAENPEAYQQIMKG